MEYQSSEDDRLGFLSQFRTLLISQRYDDAWELTQNRMRLFPLEVDAYAAAGEVLLAMGRRDHMATLLSDLERNITSLNTAKDRLLFHYNQENSFNQNHCPDALMKTLSEWLNNIYRMKANARVCK